MTATPTLVPSPPSQKSSGEPSALGMGIRIGLRWKITFLVVMLLAMVMGTMRFTVVERMREELLIEIANTAVAMLRATIKPSGEVFSTEFMDEETFELDPDPEELIKFGIDETKLQFLATQTLKLHPMIEYVHILDHKSRLRALDERGLSDDERVKIQLSLLKKPYKETRPFRSLAPLVVGGMTIMAREDSSRHLREYEAPIIAWSKNFGSVKLGLSTMIVEEKVGETMGIVFKVSLWILLISIIASFVLAHYLVVPIKLLVDDTIEIAKGHFSRRVPVKSHDEIGDLTRAFNNMAAGLEQREQMKGVFGRLVSKDVMHEIMEDLGNVKVGGERREVTLLFSDVRGFTTHSEKMEPEEVTALLNEYFDLMADIVFRHKGTIDKYMGDGLMVIFGAPKSYGNDAVNAVRAAVEMRESVISLQKKWKAEGKPEFKIGVGLNTGDVTVGWMGSHQKMEYTVIGDTVNLASRIEGLNKEFNTTIIISEMTLKKVKEVVHVKELGEAKVKGKAKPVKVFELLSANGDGGAMRSGV